MKSIKYLWLVVLPMIVTLSNAMAARNKSVTITNNTAYSMSEFYASPSVNSDWDTSNNLLAGQSIAPGQSTTITISDGLDYCHYDLMGVLYGSAEYAYQYHIDTCNGGSARWNVSQ